MDDWQELLLNFWAFLIVGVVGIVVALTAFLASPIFWRRPLPPPRPKAGRWTGAEVFLVFIAHIALIPPGVVELLSMLVAVHLPDEHNREAVRRASLHLIILGSPLIVVLTLALTVGLTYAISRTRPSQFGLTFARLPANVLLGVGLYLLITIPILGIHYLVTQVPGTEKQIIERLVRQGIDRREWWLLVFMTVFGASLVEELVYRGVLQGWLRRASLVGHGVVIGSTVTLGIIAFGYLSTEYPNQPTFVSFAPLVFGCLLATGYGAWLYMLWARSLGLSHDWPWPERAAAAPPPMPRDDKRSQEDDQAVPSIMRVDTTNAARRRLQWPAAELSVYGSSMIWSMMHYEAWPAPIPLFLLGLALGWLALRTQSLIGPMVCHALFNAVACLVLYWGA